MIDHAITRILAVLESDAFSDYADEVTTSYGAPDCPRSFASVKEWDTQQIARFPAVKVSGPRTEFEVVKGSSRVGVHEIEVVVVDRDGDRAKLTQRVRRLARAVQMTIENKARLGGSPRVVDYYVSRIDYAAGQEGTVWIGAAILDVVAIEDEDREVA